MDFERIAILGRLAKNFYAWFWELLSKCPEEHSGEFFIFWKTYVFINIFGVLWKKTANGCQNCILRLQRNILRSFLLNVIFNDKYFGDSSGENFRILAKIFWTFGGKFSVELSRLHSRCPQDVVKKNNFRNLLTFYLFWTLSKVFENFGNYFTSGMSKLLSMCPEDFFYQFLLKNYFTK